MREPKSEEPNKEGLPLLTWAVISPQAKIGRSSHTRRLVAWPWSPHAGKIRHRNAIQNWREFIVAVVPPGVETSSRGPHPKRNARFCHRVALAAARRPAMPTRRDEQQRARALHHVASASPEELDRTARSIHGCAAHDGAQELLRHRDADAKAKDDAAEAWHKHRCRAVRGDGAGADGGEDGVP